MGAAVVCATVVGSGVAVEVVLVVDVVLVDDVVVEVEVLVEVVVVVLVMLGANEDTTGAGDTCAITQPTKPTYEAC